MLAGLSVHSFLEGFTIGHEKKDDETDDCNFHLFATYVLLTKILLAFFAGLKGIGINDRIYPGSSNPKKYIMWTFIIIFIFMSPLGLGCDIENLVMNPDLSWTQSLTTKNRHYRWNGNWSL